MIQVLQFILALSLLVLLHEGGHFFFSKLFGVRVNKFYVFFDWKFSLFSTYSNWFRRLRGKAPAEKDKDGNYVYDGTEYGIGWIPLGGYCQIEGMVDETQHDAEKLKAPAQPWEFRSKPIWQRMLIMLGGVMVNFFLALFIYAMILFVWGDSYVATRDMSQGMKFNAQAQEYGFRDHDILLGTEQGDFKAFDIDVYRAVADAKTVRVLRDGKEVSVSLPGNLNLLEMAQSSPRFLAPYVPAEIDSVAVDGPAGKAGMKDGDKLLAINGTAISSWNELDVEVGRLVDGFADAQTPADSLALRTMQVVVMHKDAEAPDTLTLVADLVYKKKFLLTTKDVQSMIIGVYKPVNLGKITTDKYSFFASFPAGAKHGMKVLKGYIGDMRYLFSAEGAKSLGGFGAIGGLFSQTWDWYRFWSMTALLSIILAFMNVLPIPALDGGHFLFLCYEMIFRRKPSDEFLVRAEYVGFGILLALMIVANLNDVLRWLGLM